MATRRARASWLLGVSSHTSLPIQRHERIAPFEDVKDAVAVSKSLPGWQCLPVTPCVGSAALCGGVRWHAC